MGRKMNGDVFNIGKKYLEEIDNFIAKNFHTLKCKDIYDIYFKFFETLKEFRGTSTGFTGLSEFLIFRFLYHQLGGLFERKRKTKDLYYFISKYNKNLQIGQNIPVSIGDKKIYPDISIYYSKELVGVIQIKVYLTHGIKEVEKEIEMLEKLKSHFQKLRALLIIFFGPYKDKKASKVFCELENQKNLKEWFNFLILRENEELLEEKLEEYLGLERITSA